MFPVFCPLGNPASSEVNFREWVKLKKTLALLVLLTLFLAGFVSMGMLYFLTDCGEFKLNILNCRFMDLKKYSSYFKTKKSS